ncbi:MAG: cysteine desulfurase NifS [Rhodobacteraceae bacterium]|nr:MAG: cysteine desulfurase NifS [Paracoccaceae bacterium]
MIAFLVAAKYGIQQRAYTDYRLRGLFGAMIAYLDNNSTTKPSPQVVKAVLKSLEHNWGNASSPHGFGQTSAKLIATARDQVAALVGVTADQVVFTSGATEANEAVLRHHLANGRILITSDIEHPAVTGVYRSRAPELIRIIPVDHEGRWDLDALETQLAGPPALVAVAWANGETGVLQNIQAISDCARNQGAQILLDASQAVGRIPIDDCARGATYITLSGHKLHAPKGTGALIQINELLDPVVIQVGGEQELGLRGGTENVPGIIGFGVACELRRRNIDGAIQHLADLRNRFETALGEKLPDIRVNGVRAPRVPNTSNITFCGVDGMALVARLEDKGILCSQLSACSSGSPEPSRTLTAMGLNSEQAFASVRFAFSVDNTLAEVEFAIQIIVAEVIYLREILGGLI